VINPRGRKVYLFRKLRERKMLLIDDDEWIRDSLSFFFEDEGCHLASVETAKEGLEELKRQPYDIIIVDYRLPDMDGLEFLKQVRVSHPDALTILVTAYGSKEVFLKARKIGVQGFIDKPFTLKAIKDTLSDLLEKHNDSGDSALETEANSMLRREFGQDIG
jgi:DNA-binding NtrC family response regulator